MIATSLKVSLSVSMLIAVTLPLPAQDIRITTTNPLLASGGGRVTWGAKNNMLVYDSPSSATGYYDMYESQPDGSGAVCLTCGVGQLGGYNKGDPEWDPSNQFIAFNVQWEAIAPSDPTFNIYTPGGGVGNDLWIMDVATKSFYQITQNVPGILHPRWSHAGTQLAWVQRTTGNNWNLMLGDFAVTNGTPAITNIQSLPPCASGVFCETGGFSYDDSMLFFTSTLGGQQMNGIDIYSYNLSSGTTTQLTNSPNNWDEFPYSFPNANKIIWMSGTNLGGADGQLLQTDYWMMNNDGTEKVQLTFYNNANAPSWYRGNGVSCAKMNWSPDGTQIAAHTIPNGVTVANGGTVTIIGDEVAAPTLSAASFARPPFAPESIVSTFYTNIATATQSPSGATLPMTLGGTTVTVTDAQGTVRPAGFYFASPDQINWEIPAGTTPGPATFQFINPAGATVSEVVDVELAGPGLFAVTGTGSGPAAGYVLSYAAGSDSPTTQGLNSCSGGTCTTTPIVLNSSSDTYLILFGTGMRHATGVVTANIGTLTGLPVSYSGAQGFDFGLDQINIQIPNSLIGAGVVNLSLSVADPQPDPASASISSNTVQVQFQ